jgi:hypothetical protein
MNFPVDAVITWVDGSDPAHAARMREFGAEVSFSEEDVAGSTRFASIGEIYWCVESIRRFAPFIRTIYIVTDGQDPGIPEGNIPVKIIDHKVIFRGYEKYLPVFNSIAIETMTWRIPGLAEHYVEFNDDFMLCAPVSVMDFFAPDGAPVCYASFRSIPLTRFTRAIKKSENGHRKVTFKGMMVNGAVRAGARMRYLKLDHTPRALLRSFFDRWYELYPEDMLHNISFRFRDASQFSSEELQYVYLNKRKQLIILPVSGRLFYMEPKDKKDYIPRKMKLLKNGSYKFCCFNSLDKASQEEAAPVIEWINNTLSR